MPPERMEFRIALAHVDRGLDATRTIVISRHSSETPQHVVLRMLSLCLLYDEAITFGPGLSVGDAPDLELKDLTGTTRLWVACGNADPELVRKVLQHHREANMHIVFDQPRRREDFLERVARLDRLPKGWDRLTLWTLDERLVHALADRPGLRHRWNVTISGDVFYVEVDGSMLEGPAEQRRAAS